MFTIGGYNQYPKWNLYKGCYSRTGLLGILGNHEPEKAQSIGRLITTATAGHLLVEHFPIHAVIFLVKVNLSTAWMILYNVFLYYSFVADVMT